MALTDKDKDEQYESETKSLVSKEDLIKFDQQTSDTLIHEEVLEYSLSQAERVCIIGFFETFFGNSRSAVWILYARHFESSTAIIGACKFVGYEVNAIAGLVGLLLSKRYGYDKMLAIGIVLVLIGTFLESIATNFATVLTGFCITQIPLMSMCITFGMYVVPRISSTKIILKYSMWRILAALLAPVVAGIIAYYTDSYRLVFIVNLVICGVFTIFIFGFIYGIESRIVDKQRDQLDTGIYSREPLSLLDPDSRFPVIENARKLARGDEEEVPLIIPDYGFYQWVIYFCFRTQHSFAAGFDTINTVWFTVYCKDKFDITILEASLYMALIAITVFLTITIFRKIVDSPRTRFNGKSKTFGFDNPLMIVYIIAHIILIFLQIIVLWVTTVYDKNDFMKFIAPFFIICGVVRGVLAVCTICFFMAITPLHAIAFANGVGLFMVWNGKAIAVGLVGILWDITSYQSMWIIRIGCFGLSLATTIIVAAVETVKHRNQWDV